MSQLTSLIQSDFNPRSPYGERLFPQCCAKWQTISIHAPLTGSDRKCRGGGKDDGISIHAPLTGSDCSRKPSCDGFSISIHAPLTGSDILPAVGKLLKSNFNPRSPYGERPRFLLQISRSVRHFNPRSPYGERHQRYQKVGLKK